MHLDFWVLHFFGFPTTFSLSLLIFVDQKIRGGVLFSFSNPFGNSNPASYIYYPTSIITLLLWYLLHLTLPIIIIKIKFVSPIFLGSTSNIKTVKLWYVNFKSSASLKLHKCHRLTFTERLFIPLSICLILFFCIYACFRLG